MPEHETDFVLSLGNSNETLRVRFVREGKSIIRFTVQYETEIESRAMPVVRYDTAHGAPHRDILNWDGSTRHSNPMWDVVDYAAAMNAAIEEIEANWQRYRSEFYRRRT